MALQHKKRGSSSYVPPLQGGGGGGSYYNNFSRRYSNNSYQQQQASKPNVANKAKQEEEDKEEKQLESDENVITSLPLSIFGDGASRFMCEQCNNVPLKVASCNNGHVFCKNCILELMNNNRPCPVDKTQITQPTLNTPVLDKMISNEKVTCLYASASVAISADSNYDEGGGTKKGDDCHWEGTVSELFTHLEHCSIKPVKCPFNAIGCKQELKTDQVSTHYNEFNIQHQNFIISEFKKINSKISTMQNELSDLRSLIVGPGGGFKQQMDELRKLIKDMQRNGKSGGGKKRKNKDDSKSDHDNDDNIDIVDNDGESEESLSEGPGGIKSIDLSKNLLIGVGCNEKGDLGLGHDDPVRSLQELQWSRGLNIKKIISCSYKAFCFLTKDETVYISGCNDFGQLGLGNEEDQFSAKLHPFFSGQKLNVVATSRSINAFHVFFICRNGVIYGCGANEYGQLGLDNQEPYTLPEKNTYFSKDNISIISIECGEYHSLFLSSDGIVYSCGLNESYQLGYQTSSEYQKKPKRITNLKTQICAIAAGRDHSYCLDINGNVWSFGSNYRGQLGMNKSQQQNDSDDDDEIINKIQWFENQNKKIIAISSGNYHGAALDKSGNVYVWGRGDEGQIGNNKKSDRFIPTMVDGFNNIPIRSISCGCHHTIAIDQESNIFCWGNNRYNQCADTFVDNFDGQHNFIKKAKVYYKTNVENGDKIQHLSAGSYHTLLLLNKP